MRFTGLFLTFHWIVAGPRKHGCSRRMCDRRLLNEQGMVHGGNKPFPRIDFRWELCAVSLDERDMGDKDKDIWNVIG